MKTQAPSFPGNNLLYNNWMGRGVTIFNCATYEFLPNRVEISSVYFNVGFIGRESFEHCLAHRLIADARSPGPFKSLIAKRKSFGILRVR